MLFVLFLYARGYILSLDLSEGTSRSIPSRRSVPITESKSKVELHLHQKRLGHVLLLSLGALGMLHFCPALLRKCFPFLGL